MEIEKSEKLSKSLKAKKQRALKEKNKDKNVSGFEKNKLQEKIKEEFNELQSELADLKTKNKELSKPLKIETEEAEEKINQLLEESLKKLSENKIKKASENQEKAGKSLDELADSMEKLSKGGGEKPEEDIESLRML